MVVSGGLYNLIFTGLQWPHTAWSPYSRDHWKVGNHCKETTAIKTTILRPLETSRDH